VTDRHSNAGPAPLSPEPDFLSVDIIYLWCHNQLRPVDFRVELTNIPECGRPHLDIIRIDRKAVGNGVACTTPSGNLVYCPMILRASHIA
jgi:hypothetical protein